MTHAHRILTGSIATALFNIALFGPSLNTHSAPPIPGTVPEQTMLYLKSSQLGQGPSRYYKGSRPTTRTSLLNSVTPETRRRGKQ